MVNMDDAAEIPKIVPLLTINCLTKPRPQNFLKQAGQQSAGRPLHL